MQNVVIHVSDPALPAAARLITQLDDYLNHLYPAEQPCPPFGDYTRDPLSLFMEKRLQSIPQRSKRAAMKDA